MKTAALVPLEEYLNTTYNPDCDYVDGEVLERNVGEQDHSDIQSELVHFFRTRRRTWKARAYVEQRVQVVARRFRIPDVCVVVGESPKIRSSTSRPSSASKCSCRGILTKACRTASTTT